MPAQIDIARQEVENLFKGHPVGPTAPAWQSFPSQPNVPEIAKTIPEDAAKSNAVTSGDSGLLGTPGMFLSAFAQSTSSPSAGQVFHAEPVPTVTVNPEPITVLPKSRPIPSPPRMSDTPAEPQLSPTKWVHQPLVVRQVDQQDSAAPTMPRSTMRDEDQSSAQQAQIAEAVDVLAQPPHPADPVRPLTQIRRAAMRQRAKRPAETVHIPTQTERIQPGYSIEALRKTAMELITEAQLKIDIRAYMSAEEKAKQALELITQTIDTREQSSVATRDLMISLTAIREAEDFVGKYGMVDGATITRMVRSHSTEILKPYDTSNLNGLAAADVYLDWSRRCVTPLAVADPLAAEAIRILAQSHRLRDDGTPFGIATSVHLIRAAVEGSPDNQQVRADYETTLQVAGLSGHASIIQSANTVAIAQSHQARPIAPASAFADPQTKDVKIIEVSPAQFASISPATAGPPGTPHAPAAPIGHQHTAQSNHQGKQQHGPYRPDHVNEVAPSQGPDDSVKSRLSRALNPITRHLR